MNVSPPLTIRHFCQQREWEKKMMWNWKILGFSWAVQRSIYHLLSSKNHLLICCHLPLLLQPRSNSHFIACIISTLNHALNNCVLDLVFIFNRDWGHPDLLYWKDDGFCGFSIVLQIFLCFPDCEPFLKFHSLHYYRLLNVNQPSAVFPRLETNDSHGTKRCEFSPFLLIDSKLQSLLVTTPLSPATACPTNALVVQPHMDVPDVPSTQVDIPEEIAAGGMV